METAKLEYFKNAGRVLLYLALAAGIFFAAAIMILTLRGHRADVYPMPDVMDRYYVDVHNELTRIGLRVNLVKKSYPDITPGVVLYQSIPAGKKVGRLEKVTIYINHAEPLIKMPGLVGNTLDMARATLSQITFQDVTYALEIAQVTEIFDESRPAGSIVSQYPLPEQPITVQQKVYLLVSSRTKPREKKFEGHMISILHEYFRETGQTYVISEIKNAPAIKDQGLVFKSEKKEDTYFLSVYYRPSSVEGQVGLNLIEFDGQGSCKIYRHGLEKKEEYGLTLKEMGRVRFLALRKGPAQYSADCDGRSVYQETFDVHDFS